MVKLLVGVRCKLGDVLCLSRSGRLRPHRAGDQQPVGFALTALKRGATAVSNGRGGWRDVAGVDPELTAVSAQFFVIPAKPLAPRKP